MGQFKKEAQRINEASHKCLYPVLNPHFDTKFVSLYILSILLRDRFSKPTSLLLHIAVGSTGQYKGRPGRHLRSPEDQDRARIRQAEGPEHRSLKPHTVQRGWQQVQRQLRQKLTNQINGLAK
ncbi:hypothetical protein MHYP_G00174210 [Metynnis hypsauchen]